MEIKTVGQFARLKDGTGLVLTMNGTIITAIKWTSSIKEQLDKSIKVPFILHNCSRLSGTSADDKRGYEYSWAITGKPDLRIGGVIRAINLFNQYAEMIET